MKKLCGWNRLKVRKLNKKIKKKAIKWVKSVRERLEKGKKQKKKEVSANIDFSIYIEVFHLKITRINNNPIYPIAETINNSYFSSN